jgi:energy-coupling factor transport system permease protein
MKAGYKLAWLAAFSVLAVALPVLWLPVMAMILMTYALLARASPLRLGKMLLPAVPVIAVLAVLQALFQGMGPALVSSLRLLLLYLAGSAVTITAGEAELTEALEKALRIFGKSFARDLATIMMLAIAFIPIVREEFEAVKTAQEARGVSFRGLKMAGGIISIVVPLLYSLADRADRIATAMEARCYGLDK